MYDGTPCIVVPGVSRSPKGYGWTGVRRFGRRVNLRHRLAWIDHHGCLPPDDRPFVLHHCDNPPCENADHLYAGTEADNRRDMYARDRQARGEVHGRAKLTEIIVRQARKDHAGGVTGTTLARRYGVTYQTMRSALRRETWKHVA